MIREAIQTVLFYLLAVLGVGFAVAVVRTRHILRAGVYLMGALTITAGFYALLGAPFVAAVDILVYVGGIVVLFVFGIMLSSTAELLDDVPTRKRRFAGLAAAVLFFGLNTLLCLTTVYATPGSARLNGSPADIGRALLRTDGSGYALPFELVSLLLLAVVIGGIVLARKIPAATGTPPERPREEQP